jgi:hypothetical protein
MELATFMMCLFVLHAEPNATASGIYQSAAGGASKCQVKKLIGVN